MKKYHVLVQSVEAYNDDVLKIITSKPKDFMYTPGQATGISIDKPNWVNEKRSFTFTSIPSDEFLEFTIKVYPEHHGITAEMLNLKENDELILHEIFGNIKYKDEGVFIAGGAGITPFLSILRELKNSDIIGENKLIFANKTHDDIINEEELHKLLGDNFVNILSNEHFKKYDYGYITEAFLLAHTDILHETIYLCGPPAMMESVELILQKLNISPKSIIKESF